MVNISEKSPEVHTRFWQKMSLVAEIAQLCKGSPPCSLLFDQVLELIKPLIPFDGATLYLNEDEQSGLKKCSSLGEEMVLENPFSLFSDELMSETNRFDSTPIILTDQEEIQEYSPQSEFGTLMIAPLFVDKRLLGILALGRYHLSLIQDKDVKLLAIVAGQLALSIEQQFYRRQIEARNAALETIQNKLRLTQERLVQQEKLAAVTELAASINHEINNPLTSVIGNIQFLRVNGELDAGKLDERLEKIEEAALRIAEVNRKLICIESLVTEACPGLPSGRILNLDESSKNR